MPSKKRERRIAATNLEYEEHVKSSAKEAVLAATKDEDLFVIDRTGSKNKRRQLVKNAVVVADKSKAVSKVEEHLIKKKVDSLARGELTLNQKRDKVLDEKKVHLMDMWGDDDIAPNSKKTTTNGKGKGKKNAMIAGPGFSYNPVDTAHQDTLAEALALEIKENERKVREQQGFAKPQIRGNNQVSWIFRSIL